MRSFQQDDKHSASQLQSTKAQSAQPDTTKQNQSNIGLKSSETTSSIQIEFEELDEEESRSFRHETTSTMGIPIPELVQPQGPALRSTSKPATVSAQTSTPIMTPCGCPDTVFYNQFQHIGTETRYAEFKKGGVIQEEGAFRNTVARYACGFLNSEGGTLYLGVNDNGIVLGIKANASLEETLRQDIDFAIGLIEPDVEKAAYSVNFARIMETNGDFAPDLKVLEICVKPKVAPINRHSYNGVVYIRRDGSLQALQRESTTR
jgi:hypothetical protein